MTYAKGVFSHYRLAGGLLGATFRQLSRDKLSILTFHGVPPAYLPLRPDEVTLDRFEETIKAIRGMADFLPLDDALKRIKVGGLKRGAVAVTFDDGYATWVPVLAPLLERLNIPATFFVTTDPLIGETLWSERLHRAISLTDRSQLSLKTTDGVNVDLSLRSATERCHALQVLDGLLKYCGRAERESMLHAIENQCNVIQQRNHGFTAEDVKYLHSRGFSVGAHSASHTVLTHCPDEEILSECGESRELLEGIIGARVRGFAYPNGIPNRDFTMRHVDILRRIGFDYAVTTAVGVVSPCTDQMLLPRFTPWGPTALRVRGQMLRNLCTLDPLELTDAPSLKRVLMVAFHFPPQVGSSGMLRTLNFAKYLSRYGWRPTVLTAQPTVYERSSLDMAGDIPASCGVLRAAAWDSASAFAIRGKYMGISALPDRWWTWTPQSMWKGWRHLRRTRAKTSVQVIWSTYPISTAHLIAGGLARLTGLPWVADFRDPMTASDEQLSGMKRRVWRALEQFTVSRADRCIFTTETARDDYSLRYPDRADRFIVVENGYDEDVFSSVSPYRAQSDAGLNLMLHSGGIYPAERDPSRFFEALRGLLDSGTLNRKQLRVRFRASGHDALMQDLAKKYGLADVFEAAGPLPYREALAEMMGADLLLLFQGPKFRTQIPAKAYEYVRAARPVLGAVGKSSQTADMLRVFRAVHLTEIDDKSGIEQALRNWLLSKHDQALLSAQISENVERIRVYSRENRARQMAMILDDLTKK